MDALKSLGKWIAYHPMETALFGPWVIMVLPFSFFSWLILPWPPAREFAAFLANWIPMINRFADHAANPEFIRIFLTCIWIFGFFWIPVVMIMNVIRDKFLKHIPRKTPGEVFFGVLWMTIVLSLCLLVWAHASPGSGRISRTITYLFSTGHGLMTIGWFLIISPFVFLGGVFATGWISIIQKKGQ